MPDQSMSRKREPSMIETFGLGRRFGDFTAVDRISLRVPAGSVPALLGPSGAGKTITVRMLAGLLAPTAGTATVAGFDARRDPAAIRARVGLVTDVPGLYEQMTTPAYLDFFGAMYGMPAPPGPVAAAGDAAEAGENILMPFLQDAGALIVHSEDGGIPVILPGHGNGPAPGGTLGRVIQQVGHHLRQPIAIPDHAEDWPVHADMLSRIDRLHPVYSALNQRPYLQRLTSKVQRVILHLIQQEQILHHPLLAGGGDDDTSDLRAVSPHPCGPSG